MAATDDLENLGLRLKEMRLARYLTQKELATLSGVAYTTIARIEAGGHWPRPATIRKLCEALEVSPEWLVIGKES